MQSTERQTRYRWTYLWAGALVALAGFVLLAVALASAQAWAEASSTLGLCLLGWGSLAQLLNAVLLVPQPSAETPLHTGLLLAGTAVWLAGWGLIAAGIRRAPESSQGPSPAAGAPLYPRLARYQDFYWGTLLAYGGGFLLAEAVILLLQTVLAGGASPSDLVAGAAKRAGGMEPPGAFAIALAAGAMVAFLAGFIGASRARRLSLPEATIGVLYLGLPIPIVLTLMERIPELQLALGYHLHQVTYVAGLLGRPELGYWLVFAFLVLALVLGVNTGFVAAGSGRVDVKMGFELFVARRHVEVFRPSLLLGTLAVLMLGIIPPLLIYFIIRSAEASVERTRIRKLGLADPLAAASDLHRLKQHEQSPTMMMTALSVGGVGVGVMALIITLSVMSGFEAELQRKILGTNAHAVVSKYAGDMTEFQQVMEDVRKVPGVVGQTPFIINQVMIVSEGNVNGVVIKGIDPDTVGEVADLPKNLLDGATLDALSHPEKVAPRSHPEEGGHPPTEESKAPVALPGIIVGRELAASLRVKVGDQVSVVSPMGTEVGVSMPTPKSRGFRVVAIFYAGMNEYDSKFVYIHLEEAQDFFDVKGATGIELKVADIDEARNISSQVTKALGGYPYRARDWGAMNRTLFSALRLQKLVMGIILSIIIIVAAGLIVATVVMLVLEKRKEISVLKALGVPDGGIVKIFLAEGLQIGVAGGFLGLLSGLSWCVFIEKVGIKLDAAVYFMPELPVRIEPVQTVLAVVIAVLVTYLASIYPALKASSVEPVEGLKAE
ncbi:LolC/E family lipoprotein releasing system, transmembrane protein [Myxococcus stipitatus DSM 14675]|uniref:LolC/E family lipoprotein releasing system, transmembrane protein n=1 Tax=Myxococcus stipitatus (strain DSM 14675 / JCM 12634 / Mx s8) TaxID=1278073 RepID=L7U9L1_MYXSD|nr:ABC transporter permease [Myxococcus stipitatus]AGC43154.1 LolC/E family lipoprotein releasing system, transmembrane protein [Myxococcus stipitatus DSM 14675]